MSFQKKSDRQDFKKIEILKIIRFLKKLIFQHTKRTKNSIIQYVFIVQKIYVQHIKACVIGTIAYNFYKLKTYFKRVINFWT